MWWRPISSSGWLYTGTQVSTHRNAFLLHLVFIMFLCYSHLCYHSSSTHPSHPPTLSSTHPSHPCHPPTLSSTHPLTLVTHLFAAVVKLSQLGHSAVYCIGGIWLQFSWMTYLGPVTPMHCMARPWLLGTTLPVEVSAYGSLIPYLPVKYCVTLLIFYRLFYPFFCQGCRTP